MKLPTSLTACAARTAVVLGSGLGPFVEGLEIEHSFGYGELGLPASKVPGHAGRLLVANLSGNPLLVADGRVHLYEGWNPMEVTMGVRLLHSLGVKTLVLTNAAGSLRPDFPPGSWMILSDHINLTGCSPLAGSAQFVDLSEVYSRRLRSAFLLAASSLGLPLLEGVYAGVSGPQYETPAEIRMLQRLGADAVGMSTVPEAIQARALGLEVAAFSCLTNWGAGLSGQPLSHEEVTATGRTSATGLIKILRATLPEI